MKTMTKNRITPEPPTVAYMMSRFPKLTETFILYEMIALEKLGFRIEIFPLLKQKESQVHEAAKSRMKNAHFVPFLNLTIFKANLSMMLKSPARYFSTLFFVLYHTCKSANFFLGAIGIFPKAVHFALIMQEKKSSHIHAHFATHPTVAALIIHRLTGIPYSFTAHGSDLHVNRQMLRQKLEAALFGITISRYNKNVMVQECGKKYGAKIHIVHCGVDPKEFSVERRKWDYKRLHILSIGSLEEVKGHEYLITACAELERQNIPFNCRIIGYGPLKTELQALIDRSGLTSKVMLLGGQPRDKVLEELERANTFVLASVPTRAGKKEGIPVVLMEAMATGLPVISSRLSGIPELVTHNLCGLLVEPGDSPALARCLRTLFRDPELARQFGEYGRQRVERDFNLSLNAEKLGTLFLQQKLIKSKIALELF
jgi:glycosyltransferase involved in cell wall biosynthesis